MSQYPLVPIGDERRAKIARIHSSLSKEQRNDPRYAADSHTLWTMYFDCRREDQIAFANDTIPCGRLNNDGRREWWGVPDRTL